MRHAGAPIETGLRYVIGAFIALDDKVEHVRRLGILQRHFALREDVPALFSLFRPQCVPAESSWLDWFERGVRSDLSRPIRA